MTAKLLRNMVGGGRIELPTPTMSTERPRQTRRNSAAFWSDRAAFSGHVPPLFTVAWYVDTKGNYVDSPSITQDRR